MLSGGQHGPAIVPGDAESSRLYRLVAGKEEPRMPFGGKLSDSQVAVLRDWINQGAEWEAAGSASASGSTSTAGSGEFEIPAEARQYWAFRKPVRPRVPRVRNREWGRHPIDAFLEQVFEQKGMTPAPPADRVTLVRRAYLDLLGLPPSPEEVAEFVNDAALDAWEKLIERLLASPHYGERWGRHWLDVARYADSSGFDQDWDRPTAWRYRDYVVESFNKDTPYNVFIAEQLAGDELDSVSLNSKTATGFLRAGPRVAFREKDNPQYRFDYLDDMIATTSQAFLGLTVQCARCHNHKFDPISQTDYYRMQAVFFPYVDVNHYLGPEDEVEAFLAKKEEIDAKVKALRQRIAEIERPYREKFIIAKVAEKFPEDALIAVKTPEEQRTPGQKLLAIQIFGAIPVQLVDVECVMDSETKAKRDALDAQVKELEEQRPQPPPSAIGVTDGDYRFAPDGPGDKPAPGKGTKRDPNLKGSFLHKGDGPYKPPPSYFLIGGDRNSRGALMEPGFITVAAYGNPPTAIPPSHGRSSGRRRALAEWIGSPDNPLTARVMVNRIWHHHFGRGIVSTLNNFGKMGERPTHPELLDWLATELVARGWSIKQMHRLIMTSNAYRMASQYENAANQKADLQNRLLWKFRIQRLEAEALRDSILAVSGQLNRKIGSPPVFPKVDPSVLVTMKFGIWKQEEEGPKVWRRSVYVYRKRGMPFPMFEVFDLPNQNASCGARNVSTTATQALTLLNNEFVLQQARFFTERVVAEAGPKPADQLARAYLIALGRNPSPEEKRLGMEFLESQRQFHRMRSAEAETAAGGAAAKQAETGGAAPKRDIASASRAPQGVSPAHLAALTDLAHVLLNLNEFVYIR